MKMTPPKHPEGIPTPLENLCQRCNQVVVFDYQVKDSLWETTVPERYRIGVLCLPCLEQVCHEIGEPYILHLVEAVWFTGRHGTLSLKPSELIMWCPR